MIRSFFIVNGSYCETVCLGCGRTGLPPTLLTCTTCGCVVPIVHGPALDKEGRRSVQVKVDLLAADPEARTLALLDMFPNGNVPGVPQVLKSVTLTEQERPTPLSEVHRRALTGYYRNRYGPTVRLLFKDDGRSYVVVRPVETGSQVARNVHHRPPATPSAAAAGVAPIDPEETTASVTETWRDRPSLL